MYSYVFYALAIVGLAISAFKSKEKTRKALIKSWRSFENIMPQFLVILLLIGLMLAIVDAETISMLLGKDSGALGMGIAAVIGSVTLVPGFIAFPLAASLLEAGAGYGQIAMFVTTLMMVGLATLPLEISFFGKKMAVRRNLLAIIYAVVSSLIIGALL